MTKTLLYVPGSPTSVKLGDTDTNLYLQVAKDNAAVDLTTVKSITVKIADANKNYLKDISIAPASLTSGNNGILAVPLNSDNIGGLNSGDYYFEVWIITADSETEIYPDMNVTKFHVFNNLVGGTTVLTTLTMQAFLDKITSTQAASETSLSNSQIALAEANIANTNATKALSDLNAGNYLTKDTLSSATAFENLQTQVNNSAVGTNLLLQGNFSQSNINFTNGALLNGYSGTLTNGIVYYWYSTPNFIPVLANTSYIVSLDSTQTSVTFEKSAFYDSSGSLISLGGGKFTTPSNATQLRLCFKSNTSASETLNDFGSRYKIKLEKGSVATDWCPNPAEILTQTDYAKIKAAIVALGGSLS